MKINKLNIIGNGFLAQKFKKYNLFFKKKNYFIYLAGVSNSSEKNLNNLKKDFNRINQFIKNVKDNKLIYISSCSIFDPNRKNSLYLKNKLKIENTIKKKCKNFLIIRLPEIIGKNKNKNTLTNYFYNKIIESKKFILYAYARRNLLDIDDALKLILYFLNQNIKLKFLNIANIKYISPLKIIEIFEKITNKKVNCKISYKKFNKWRIINNVNIHILKKAKVDIKKNYLKKIIKKYYK